MHTEKHTAFLHRLIASLIFSTRRAVVSQHGLPVQQYELLDVML